MRSKEPPIRRVPDSACRLDRHPPIGPDVMRLDVMGFDVMGFDVMGPDVMGFEAKRRQCPSELVRVPC